LYYVNTFAISRRKVFYLLLSKNLSFCFAKTKYWVKQNVKFTANVAWLFIKTVTSS